MIWNFSFNAENQKKYDEVTANIRRLQTEMGIEPMTLEERAAGYGLDGMGSTHSRD